MSVRSFRVAVTDTRTSIVNPTDATEVAPTKCLVKNLGSDPVFVGGDDVTDANGWEFASGEGGAFELGPGDRLYGICSTGDTCSVQVVAGRRQ